MADKKSSRRDFLRLAAATTVAAGVAAPVVLASKKTVTLKPPPRPVAPADTLRIATIGMGIIGFIDTETALEVPGTELVAAADCYDSRLVRTREVFGNHVETTRDYREVLARPDVDAVLLCVPDHWHARMSVEAMEAGKAVYCEKPMVHEVAEGASVIEAQKRTGRVFQVGSQYASSMLYGKARELYEAGAIGRVNMVEATMNRNSALGAWQYSIPPDASPQTIDWDRFLGDAPRHPFDADRFFRWRKYWDYGTGVGGDLFVHLFTGIHLVLNAVGPTQVVSTGGVRFWTEKREAPDVMMALFDYPKTDHHAPFSLSLQCNLADGSGGGSVFRFIGDEGALTVEGNSLTLSQSPRRRPPDDAVIRGYNSVRTFSEATQKAFAEQYKKAFPTPDLGSMDRKETFETPRGYDDRFDHFVNFFTSIREGKPVYEDAVFGFRAAAPSLLCNMSYRDQKIYRWDPVAMQLRA